MCFRWCKDPFESRVFTSCEDEDFCYRKHVQDTLYRFDSWSLNNVASIFRKWGLIKGLLITKIHRKIPTRTNNKKSPKKWWRVIVFFRKSFNMTRWWFQTVFIFTPIWGRFPFWLIFFRWVETTNQMMIQISSFLLSTQCFALALPCDEISLHGWGWDDKWQGF